MTKSKKLLGVLLVISLVFNTLAIGASAVLNDGNMLSADINLEIGTVSGSVFTPLETGTALHTGDVITVRICPTSDFYCGVSRYVVMFSSAYLSIVGTGNTAFTPNMANAFYAAVASGYNAATAIPVTAWPASLQSQFDTYTAVAVNNNANSNAGNGGYPDFLPGDWLFSFKLTVTQDITPDSGARIWMDSRWFKNPSNITGAAYFAKCTSPTQLSTSGSSTIYYFNIDLTDADKNLEPLSKITFDSAGGSAVASVKGDYGSAVPAVTAPVKPGYTFTGWNPAIPVIFPEGNLTCTATWVIPTVCVTFNANGGFGDTSFCGHPFDPFIPPTVTRPGYIFVGWSPEVPPNWPSEDTTYTALWAVDSYTITFDANGGTGGGSNSCDYGATPTPISAGTKTGYTFTGWDPSIVAATGDATYTAQWQVNSYTITFDANGGTGSAADVTQDYGTQVLLPSTGFTKTGYTFIGWNTAPDATTVLISYYVPATNVTLYAVYEISYVLICFDANGGEGFAECVLVGPGDPIPWPTTGFTRSGYTFIGWNTDPNATSPLVSLPPILSDMTLYAIYQINQYTVCFDANGGTGPAVYVTQDYDTEVPLPTTGFEKTGYTFIGWNTTPDASTVLTSYSMPAADVTLYAIYEINTYNAVFMVDGSIYEIVPTVYGENIVVPAEPVKAGYIFIGWSPDVGTIGAYDVEFNARWNRIPVTLSAKTGSATIIDQTKGFIYGLEEGMTIETFLGSAVTVSGDGRLEVQHFTAGFGTHTRIDLVDNVTGLVIKTFTIIIYGDINGDGSVDSMDAGTAVDFENYLIDWLPPYDEIMLFAGDLNGDGEIDSLDAGKMVDAENYILTINQVTGLTG